MTQENRVRETYDNWHAERAVDVESDAPWHSHMKPLLRGELNDKAVLEIACGRGGFAAWLGSKGGGGAKTVVAADFSSIAVGKAEQLGKERHLDNVSYQQADLMALPWSNESFDVAVSCETIEHVPDPQWAIRELARVLRLGGTLYLSCPNYLNASGLYRIYRQLRRMGVEEEGQPINHFLFYPQVVHWLRRAGLKVKRFDGIGHYFPFPGRPPVRIRPFDQIPGAWPFSLHAVLVARKE